MEHYNNAGDPGPTKWIRTYKPTDASLSSDGQTWYWLGHTIDKDEPALIVREVVPHSGALMRVTATGEVYRNHGSGDSKGASL